jgi:hypothetical protein
MDGNWTEVDDREAVSDARLRFVEWWFEKCIQAEQRHSDALLLSRGGFEEFRVCSSRFPLS